ncbi:MAG: UDP-N-acetylmuramoyl-L-alanine--D-glutamate ligase [Bacillota bacterium]|nr:UDP-N-acetylmuramoyl-L-alanine--D-glutamate ligase [Bacillota bacterium]
MNLALESYKKKIKGKQVAVLGFGVSNRPLAGTLTDWGAFVTVFDKKKEEDFSDILRDYKEKGIQFSLGENYLDNLKGFDIIFRTPGMRFDLPQIARALEKGAELTSEIEIFIKLCPAKIYGVTGSDGKTTTASLIYNMLEKQGYNCYLGGNIGTPLFEKVELIKPDDRVVLELSSFQLHTMNDSPHVAVITNITPNHLDVHLSMEEYICAKKNIFRYQAPTERIVLNADNLVTAGFLSEVPGKPVLFSSREEVICGAFLKNNHIVYRDTSEIDILPIEKIKLPGMHNVENIMAAISAVIPEVSTDAIRYVAQTFEGVEHRIEFVREIDGVSFYNNSIGSSPTRTIASLKAFNRKVVLIAGGYDKNLSYDEMGEVLHDHVNALVLMGDTARKIEQAYRKYTDEVGIEPVPIIRVFKMEAAVKEALSLAGAKGIVLLSPASASFDMYSNFMEKGNHFKDIVNSLGEQKEIIQK